MIIGSDMPCSRRLRICLVYDCLYPHTVGGAERWYRNLAERLAAEGHEVTYLTLRQWERDATRRPWSARASRSGPRMTLYIARPPANPAAVALRVRGPPPSP